MSGLGHQLKPCGPLTDAAAAERVFERLSEAASEHGWTETLRAAQPALEPVFAASPYLAGLVRRSPERLHQTLATDPTERLAEIIRQTRTLHGGVEAVRAPLRQLKADLHLLSALADLGGVWALDDVTAALSAFADAATQCALVAAAADLRARGRLAGDPLDARGPVPGLIGLAMGKHGARELNYSSDIDLSLFYEPDVIAEHLPPGGETQRFVDRLAQTVANLLSERTADGYVFRVDLRLRPDPSSTPPVVAAPMALAYYESVGQNWERAAFIKSRPVCGDFGAAERFLTALKPFVWRRSLDYQAVLDIQSIKRQIHSHKTGEGLQAAGANVKLGRGGIREIEFYAQTQQLILGGRDPGLRTRRTIEALNALRDAGHLPDTVVAAMSEAYCELRAVEHRIQMIDDEQTHTLPADPTRRAAVAALSGEADLARFDHRVEALLADVNQRFGELFPEEEDLSSPWGSLVFTGVDNDPETLATLGRMGFEDPGGVSETIRSWHHGRIPATRTARGRELFTRLGPRLLTAVAKTGAPDAAFRRFAVFFAGLNSGVQVQALFLGQPELFELIVGVMAFAPRLAATLGRYPAALDSVLDARFLAELDQDSGVVAQLAEETDGVDFEEAMNATRRIHREQSFRIGMQTITGRAQPEAVGRAYTVLADASLTAVSRAALAETERMGGMFRGAVAVVALGKAGSREMTAASDLDLMTVFEAEPDAASSLKGWGGDLYYARFTQRLIAALSSRTAEGGLYEVDMRLRPSGSAGPVSVSLDAMTAYYASDAQTWEFMALTRARVAWASDPAFEAKVADALQTVLRRTRPGVDVAADVRSMRALMERERPGRGFWDLKLTPGGQVDAEFVAQYRQLKAAAAGQPLTVSTLQALTDDPRVAEAWQLQQGLAQVLTCAFDGAADPDAEPEGFQTRLAGMVGQPDLEALKTRLCATRQAAREAFISVLTEGRDG